MAGARPKERLGELAAADPEEADHLDVKLASCGIGRRFNAILASGRDRDGPADDTLDLGRSSPGRQDRRRHDVDRPVNRSTLGERRVNIASSLHPASQRYGASRSRFVCADATTWARDHLTLCASLEYERARVIFRRHASLKPIRTAGPIPRIRPCGAADTPPGRHAARPPGRPTGRQPVGPTVRPTVRSAANRAFNVRSDDRRTAIGRFVAESHLQVSARRLKP